MHLQQPILEEPTIISDTPKEETVQKPKNTRKRTFMQKINGLFSTFSQENNGADSQVRLINLFEPSSDSKDSKIIYPRNTITTSRYTLISFIPKCLLEQFRRLANVYFLVIGVIAAIGYYTNFYEAAVEPVGILAPMMIVISISMIKEGIEDIKRHNTDMKINMRKARLVDSNGNVNQCEWQDLVVGSVVLLLRDDDIPADVVVLACGGLQGPQCFVETAALDGETNLKIRQPCLQEDLLAQDHSNQTGKKEKKFPAFTLSSSLKNVGGIDQLRNRTTIQSEPPNEYVYRFNGSMEFKKDSHHGDTPTLTALSEKNLLLRGSVLRATEWAVGMVIYTGKDTKLSLNSKTPPSKLSSVDRIVNRTLAIAISVMIVVCIISMLFGMMWQSANSNANYLCLSASNLDDVYTHGGGCESGATSSVLTIFTFATLYNNFVCISMYVSLEMVYICQAYFLSKDLTVYDETTDSPAECHSSGMCADLGQVKYVLSDKTGTLTKNLMNVRRVSLGGKIFGAPIKTNFAPSISAPSVTSDSVVGSEARSAMHSSHPNDNAKRPSVNSDSSIRTSDMWLPLNSLHPSSGLSSSNKQESSMAADFLRVLVACNTVMLMPNQDQSSNDNGGKVVIKNINDLTRSLQAESADEVALVMAAVSHCGVLLTGRGNTVAEIKGLKTPLKNMEVNDTDAQSTNDNTERIEILAINEFDSNRKRMSMLAKIGSRHVLLCKGADSSMMSQCHVGPYTTSCLEHIEAFAMTGLRTLIAAKKELSDAQVKQWMDQYNIAKSSLTNRVEKLFECALSIETEMDLLGAIGIEDELQDGAPEAIQMMQRAGINVWMITGDKAETAIAIGKMCALVRDGDHLVERVIGVSDDALRLRIIDLSKFVMDHYHDTRPEKKNIALVIDGSSLEGVLKSPDLKLKLSLMLPFIPTVIACRVSPLQKAALVKMVKNSPDKPTTLAIGDGANDVGMIHEARVGVGISGREGRHAANSADFAISQFRFLVPLLFEHGRFNYIRCSKLVLYSFFKNLLLVSTLFYYCVYSGFSGTVPLSSLVFSGYNFYLGLPIIALGAMDFDVPRLFVYRYPELAYRSGRLGEMLNSINMLRWCVTAFIEGFLLFALVARFIGGNMSISSHQSNSDGNTNTGYFNIEGVGLNLSSSGSTGGIYVEGFLLYTVCVIFMQVKVMMMTYTRTLINWGVWVVSFLGYLIFTFLYGISNSTSWIDITSLALSLPSVWIGFFVIPVIMSFCDEAVDVFFTSFFPWSFDMLRSIYIRESANWDQEMIIQAPSSGSISSPFPESEAKARTSSGRQSLYLEALKTSK